MFFGFVFFGGGVCLFCFGFVLVFLCDCFAFVFGGLVCLFRLFCFAVSEFI